MTGRAKNRHKLATRNERAKGERRHILCWIFQFRNEPIESQSNDKNPAFAACNDGRSPAALLNAIGCGEAGGDDQAIRACRIFSVKGRKCVLSWPRREGHDTTARLPTDHVRNVRSKFERLTTMAGWKFGRSGGAAALLRGAVAYRLHTTDTTCY